MERAKVSRATKEMAKADPTDSAIGIKFIVLHLKQFHKAGNFQAD